MQHLGVVGTGVRRQRGAVSLVRGRMPSELHSQTAVREGRLGRETASSVHSGFRIEGTAAHASGESGKGERKGRGHELSHEEKHRCSEEVF